APPDTAPGDAEPVTLKQTLRTASIWLAVWILPLVAVSLVFPQVFTDLSVFFSKLAVVTFGGAYAVLAYMAQQAVETYGWLSAPEMLDGLGLAETTPGPLILVTEFVGFLGSYRHGGDPALAYGLLGAAVTLWATFAPCFLWIFTGAPYVEQLQSNPKLAGALRGVTAAVVGVILNLSLWFTLHVIFKTVTATDAGPFRLWVPALSSFRWDAALLAGLAAILIFAARRDILSTLAICAGASLVLSALL
ncbi:MAG: chromate transporter, partial [Methyloceanibacter sp.]